MEYTLLKMINHYYLNFQPTTVMDFQKKKGWGGRGELHQIFVWIFLKFFNFAKALLIPISTHMSQFLHEGFVLQSEVVFLTQQLPL